MKSDIANIRHTLAHLLAASVLDLYPETKLTIGPAIDNGFYYDFALPSEASGEGGILSISDKDLPKIEKKMKSILKHWDKFTHKEVSEAEAKEIYQDNPYKVELIEEISHKGEKITLYTAGRFTDLCRGGHAENPAKEIDSESFKLDRIAGAYWRGDEKNKMLTRIYGLSFNTKEELDAYIAQREEAKKRDHKKLGQQLDLFVFSDLVGPGLPLWTPKGTMLRNLLDDYVWSLRKPIGYQKVEIPHITKKELYETSGHWDKFKDELFRIKTREGHEFAMKPMNCPHHTQIYARRQFSYKELPQRYSNSTTCYRDEQTGELSGLSRVRAFTQDDAHVFCRFSQIEEEMSVIWDKIVEPFYKSFGFNLKLRLSLHDTANPEKYLGDSEKWQQAENILRNLAKARKTDFFEAVGEAAFYGPKLDFLATDSIGREWQVATIQLDMNQPERFDLTCVNEKGEKERIVMIHAAIMGSIDRFLSILIEHTAGAFPLWLSPVQVALVPVSEKFIDYANKVHQQMSDIGVRVELNEANESLGKRIREAETQKTPYICIMGEKEVESGTVSVRARGGKDLGAIKLDEFVKQIAEEIKERGA